MLHAQTRQRPGQPGAACHAIWQGGALGMTCGQFVDVAHFRIAAHKRHDSATWAMRTNVKTYTARLRAVALVDPPVHLLSALFAKAPPDSPAIARASLARTRTAGASCPADVLP
ncbi:hypothetical protein BX589_13090 [Paraburkholderia fungorum]|nr:hypothetical protein BX589_13090 [Paraburkholderia fungorum]